EQRKMFGTRTSERFAPCVALFDLAYQRFADRESRNEAVQTLEEVTQRVHGDYLRKLGALEEELGRARGAVPQGGRGGDAEQLVHLEHALAQQEEETRRTQRRAESMEQQLTAAVAQLEQAHIELHRRSEGLRQKTRTLYLIERALRLDGATRDPRQLVDGLLALVGDDMQAQRCSLMLRVPDQEALYLAATRGLAPQIVQGSRIPFGHGVAGIVAQSRETLLVQDATEARAHPLLTDQFLTTGSFISFPLIYLDELIGVVNLTDRARRGVFLEEDVERVKLLSLVISLIAINGSLAQRLLGTIDGQ
ncbi:MAG: GAF domain-containing protein, partial [Gemmatimonadaceae bacterium]